MKRNFNWLNAQRVDVPHLRLVESAVTADFQDLAGQILAGGSPLVVRGFTIPVGTAVGNAASSLTLVTAGGILMHPTASEQGSIFTVPASQTAEQLNSANSKVIGSFVPGTNYIGIDLIRLADTSTADTMKFLSDATAQEFSQTLPLGRTLQYRIYIQATDFDHALNVLPIANVGVDTNGNVTSVTDARRMAFRLGVGGTTPAARTPFTSMATRTEPGVTADSTHVIDPFTGADKGLGSLRDWMAAVMNRLWEMGSGAYWYSPTTRGDDRLVFGATVFSGSGTNYYWNGTDLLWQGLTYIFAHGETGVSSRAVQDQTSASSPSSLLTGLTDGDCIYVDLDKATAGTMVAAKGQFAALTAPTIPGSRRIFAWRTGGKVYVEGVGGGSPVDQGGAHATTTAYGTGKVYSQPTSQLNPIFPVVDGNGYAVCEGVTCGVDSPTGGQMVLGGGATTTSIALGDITHGQTTSVMGELDVYNGIFLEGSFPSIDAGAAHTLKIGGSFATEVDIGKSGVVTKILGNLIAGSSYIDGGSNGAVLQIGPSLASQVSIGASGIPSSILGLLYIKSSIDTGPSTTLQIGPTLANGISLGSVSAPTSVLGALSIVGSIDTTSGVTMNIGTSNATQINIGGVAHPTQINGALFTSKAVVESLVSVSGYSSGTPIGFDASTGSYFEVVTGVYGSNVTMNAPTNPTTGQRITVRIKNTNSGALGVLTWNSVFKLASWVQPASAFSRSIDFLYTGGAWVEISRAPNDVPN